MITIGIIDDRDNSRRSFIRKIKLIIDEIEPLSKLKDIPPFPLLEHYSPWILENNISVIIVDERLDEGEVQNGEHIKYSGYQLVAHLRTTFKDLPIFGITNYERTEDLNNSYKNYNLILGKREFDDKANEYLNLIIRSGKRFFEDYSNELNELSSLSEKVALGESTSQDVERIKTLQSELSIPHTGIVYKAREEWIETYDEKIGKLNELKEEIKNFLEEGE